MGSCHDQSTRNCRWLARITMTSSRYHGFILQLSPSEFEFKSSVRQHSPLASSTTDAKWYTKPGGLANVLQTNYACSWMPSGSRRHRAKRHTSVENKDPRHRDQETIRLINQALDKDPVSFDKCIVTCILYTTIHFLPIYEKLTICR